MLNQFPASITHENKQYDFSIHKIEIEGLCRYVVGYRNGNDTLVLSYRGLSHIYDLNFSCMSVSFEEAVNNLWGYLDDFNLLKNE